MRALSLHRALLLILLAYGSTIGFTVAVADSGTEFPGTVLMVDQATGKIAVKKDGGGTRFTFVANAQMKFQGAGLASLKDPKKDDKVTVSYQVQGSQYLAIRVTKQ